MNDLMQGIHWQVEIPIQRQPLKWSVLIVQPLLQKELRWLCNSILKNQPSGNISV